MRQLAIRSESSDDSSEDKTGRQEPEMVFGTGDQHPGIEQFCERLAGKECSYDTNYSIEARPKDERQGLLVGR
jgi:hypothetical protein